MLLLQMMVVAHAAATMPTDSLSVPLLKQTAAAYAAVESSTPELAAPKVGQDTAAWRESVEHSAPVAATLGRLQLTPTQYVNQYRWFNNAWNYIVTERGLVARGISMEQLVGPKPSPADVTWARNHEKDLQDSGLPVPPPPKFAK
jgi:hypothetical protein